MKKLSFDSTPTIKGFLFQFLIALEKCFEMQEGQTVHIETYGDVSVLGNLSDSEQLESKLYKKNLTDLSLSVWNTIHNWMDNGFPLEKFSSLVLLTTQKVSVGSKWLNWNTKSLSERMTILGDIKKKFDSQKRKSKELKTCMNVIFDPQNSARLSQIAKMLYIDNVGDGLHYYKKLQEKYAKHLPKIQKERYVNHMFGYILNPDVVNNKWQITYEDFTQEAKEVTQTLVENTAVFPEKLNLAEIKKDDYDNYTFVEKIKDIEYEDVIPDAINDYVHTASIIQHELKMSEIKEKSLLQYEENLIGSYTAKYRKASRNCHDGEQIAESQNFYDDITSSSDGTFYIYNDVPLYFHNGMMHLLANDEDNNIVWLLKK